MTILRDSPGSGAPEFVAGPDSEEDRTAATDDLGEGGQDTAIHVAAGADRARPG